MVLEANGIVHGNQIDLERDTGLPDGARVRIQIKLELTKEEAEKSLSALFGICANDPSFKEAVDEIERSRHQEMPREIEFDVAS